MVCSVCCCNVLPPKKKKKNMWLLLMGQVFQTWYHALHISVNLIIYVDCMKLGFDHETYTLYAEKYFVRCN